MQAERNFRVPCPENDTVKAVVTGFSKSGQIAFTRCEHYGTITFLLGLTVWSGGTTPQFKEVVVLSELTRSEKGWRAKKARPYTLSDENNETA